MGIAEDFDRSFDEAVTEVVADWPRPRVGTDLISGDAFRAHWATAVQLGWTSVLDEADFTEPGSEQSRELLDAACGAVTALARAGFALPLRQTLVARLASDKALPADAIAVHPTAHGVWEPVATVRVDVPAPGLPEGTDVAGRPTSAADVTREGVPDRIHDVAELLLLQEILGAAEGAATEARRYVTERVQYGRPLVKIPAVRTTVGELNVLLLQLETVVYEARRRFHADDERALRFALTTAREVASVVATEVARITHQLHGAMGITEEAGLHWRTKLLWADRDEGVFSRYEGLDTLPSAEEEFWALTGPAW
ncbi:acyl-CoA dehydrogenase family protein [Saccharopolyspora shandongensis]|uniref:acyl-CoA dehydrogenase family protein n=1 Tax=Saccharopolyspora shandongensis TaxID=418495 RepID=UPI00340DA758